jgi:hypothetical protein
MPRVSVALHLSATSVSFGHTITASIATDAGSGTATFSVNGRQVGSAVDLDASGAATRVLPLDDSTVPAGAGTYQVVASVQPTDGQHLDGSATQSLRVTPAPVDLTWTGTGLLVAGSAPTISVVVTPPAGETHFYDFSDHPVWVLFQVSNKDGVTFYYAQVANAGQSGRGSASVTGAAVVPGAYVVRTRLVAASDSDSPNAYAGTEELWAGFTGYPVRGGYMAGYSQLGSQVAAFEFTPGSTPAGSLVFIRPTQFTTPEGDVHDAYQVFQSVWVTSVSSHSHTATATGAAMPYVVDRVTGYAYASP